LLELATFKTFGEFNFRDKYVQQRRILRENRSKRKLPPSHNNQHFLLKYKEAYRFGGSYERMKSKFTNNKNTIFLI
jgi:hypothetical protein